MALAWLAAAYWTSQYVAVLPFAFVVISVFVFAVPIAISGAYSSAVDQTRMLSYYKTSGWFFRLFSGGLIRSVLWVIWALFSSFAMLLQFSTYSGLEWFTLGLAIPVFWHVHQFCNKVFSCELRKRYVVSSFAISWTRWICPFFLVALYAILTSIAAQPPNYTSLAEAVAAMRLSTPEVAGSSVVQAALLLISFLNGTKAYLGSNLKQFGEYVPLSLILVGSYIVFFNVSATFASFAIPRKEHRRIYAPLSDEEIPPPLTRSRVAIAAAVVTVVILFIYVPVFVHLEEGARANPGLYTLLKNAQLNVEKIDDEFYRPGTLKVIELAKASALAKANLSRALLDSQIDRAFDQMGSNVDGYLDWYYSLSGEYTRLARLMTGDIEKYMEEKLVEMLRQEDALKPVIAGLELALANHKKDTDAYQQEVKTLLVNNRIQVPEFGAQGIPGVASDRLLVLPPRLDVVTMQSRVVGGAAAAAIGAVIVARIVSKGLFKAAGKALSKVAITKATGTAGGAAFGATVGSVVPGAGTVIGGIMGGAIAGILTDKMLLKLEEAISREDFKNEIQDAIRESRSKFKGELFSAP